MRESLVAERTPSLNEGIERLPSAPWVWRESLVAIASLTRMMEPQVTERTPSLD
jgi:hypothetical protein